MDRSGSICAIFLLIVVAFFPGNGIVFHGDFESAVVQNNGHQVTPAASHTPHGPIIISDNADFSSQGWPGNGISGDPYVIEGLNITDNGVCISIIGTTAYFEIRNCVISSGVESAWPGIHLQNVVHGTVQDCTINLHLFGITLLYSSDCTLTNNTAANNSEYGFNVDTSDYCTLTNNTADNNSRNGFNVYTSDYCTLINNTAINNSDGFYMGGSDNCTLMNNTAINNRYGFHMGGSYNCTLMSNTASSNGLGFSLEDSSHNNLTHNTAANNTDAGFELSGSIKCTLSYNTLVNNGLVISGGYVSQWLHEIIDNTVNGKSLGYFSNLANTIIDGFQYGQMILANCSMVTVQNGVFTNATRGVQMIFCTNCTLTHITASNNTGYERGSAGFYLFYSNNCTLSHNMASNNYRGFHLIWSNNCTLTNNIAISNSRTGFYLHHGNSHTLMNNIAAINDIIGMHLHQSVNSTLVNNTAFNTRYGIYLNYGSEYTRVYLNYLGLNNASNGRDDGEYNSWDDGVSLGNYWMDYHGTGMYTISGIADNVDNYPLIWEVLTLIVDSPSDVEYYEGNTGNSITWTPIDDHPENYTIYRNGAIIASEVWDGSQITVNVDGLSLGVYNYTIVVTDIFDNTVTDTVLVTVFEAITTTTTTTSTSTTTTSTTSGTGDTTLILVFIGVGVAVVLIIIVIIVSKRKT